MKKLLLLIVVFATCCAKTEDLSGKVFVFSKEDVTAYVKLLTSKTSFSSVTVCLRFLTDLNRNYALFSMSTSENSNSFLLFAVNSEVVRIHIKEPHTDFLSLSLPPNTWHSICSTWQSDNGLAQLWVDGKPTIKRFVSSGQPISGAPITILGQEQDSHGGQFDATQSFIGMISNLHMWDYVLSSSEIKNYMYGNSFTPGNVFNWRALEYAITGQILVEEEQAVM